MAQQSTAANRITEGVIWKQLLYFFFPILCGTFFQQLYNTADAMIVGRFVGTQALAAVGGPTGTLIHLVVNLFVGIAAGTTVVVAQYYGARAYDKVSMAVHSSVALALVAGALLTVVCILAAPWALHAMDTPVEIMDSALLYIRIYFIGIVPSFFYNIGAGVLRAVGDTKRPLYFLMISCITNIVLDILFVLGFRMGVLGVACATLLSQCLSAGLVWMSLTKTNRPYGLTARKIRFTPLVLTDILRVGLPAGIQSNMYAISNLIIQSCINSFGTIVIASWTAYGKLDGFFWMIMSAYGIAITTFSGQNFGAQKYDRIRKSVKICLMMAMGTALTLSALMYTFGRPLLGLFTTDNAVLEAGLSMLRFLTPFYFTYVCVEVLSGAIRGTGDSLIPMIMTGTGVCLLRVLWVFLVLPYHRDFFTLILGYPLAWAFTSALFIIYYLKGNWLRRGVAKAQQALGQPTGTV